MKYLIYIILIFVGLQLSAQTPNTTNVDNATPDYPELLDGNCTISTPTSTAIPPTAIIIDTNPDHQPVVPPLTPTSTQTDSDGDGIPNEIECPEVPCQDTDNDGIPNYLDLDSDGDGIPDGVDQCYYTVGIPPSGCSIDQVYRKVWWVHGYKGTEFSLRNPADDVGGADNQTQPITPTGRFEVRSYRPNYSNSQGSLSSAAVNLRGKINEITENQLNTENNFIISHSMGGLVARKMGAIDNAAGLPLYNGLITFGTPHQGAHVANTLLETTKIQDAATDLCERLGAGPFAAEVAAVPIVGPLANALGLAGAALNAGCAFTVDFGFPIVQDFTSLGVEDELTTSAVAAIPAMPTDHKAVFYGVEDDDDGSMTARFVGALISQPNTWPLYGADASDGVGMAAIAAANDFYVAEYEFWVEENTPWWTWIVPIVGLVNELNINSVADAYKAGVDWFPTMNPTWKNIIGAGEIEFVRVGCDCIENEQWGSESWIVYGNDDCSTLYEDEPLITCIPRYELTFVTQPSDGFILAESAMGGPGITYDAKLMDGSNHMQMKNDSGMKDAVKKIFEDGLDQEYFKTDKRQ